MLTRLKKRNRLFCIIQIKFFILLLSRNYCRGILVDIYFFLPSISSSFPLILFHPFSSVACVAIRISNEKKKNKKFFYDALHLILHQNLHIIRLYSFLAIFWQVECRLRQITDDDEENNKNEIFFLFKNFFFNVIILFWSYYIHKSFSYSVK